MSFDVSPSGTVFMGRGTTFGIIDSNGNLWGISSDGRVTEAAPATPDGGSYKPAVADLLTSNVIAMAYVNGVVWQENTSLLWYAKVGNVPGSYDGWAAGIKTGPLKASINGTLIEPNFDSAAGKPLLNNLAGSVIVDSQGNLWGISPTGQVVENGATDKLTSNVIDITYINGKVWQENTSLLWYAKVGNVAGSYDGWSAGAAAAPTPVYRTWIGGGNNLATNAADWSPGSLPISGDQLSMNAGALMNVVGDALHGDAIYAPPGDGAAIQINVSGNANFTTGGSAIVEVAKLSQWTGGFNVGPFNGPGSIGGFGTFSNTSSAIDNVATIDVNVVGNGTFNVYASHGVGRLEFLHAVGAGQTVQIVGGSYGLPTASEVTVDDPKNFAGNVQLGFGEMTLKGLTATSYDMKQGVLTLFNGSVVIDKLNLTLATGANGTLAATGFGVSEVAGSVILHGDDGSYHETGTLLPVHV